MRRFVSILLAHLFLLTFINAQGGVNLLSNLNPYPNQGYTDIWGYSADGREYALLCTGGGTTIIDITDSSQPVEVDFIQGPFSGWRDVKTHDTYAYIVTEGTGAGQGLQIVDLSSLPQSASLVNTTDEYFESAHNIFIDDGYAYVIGTEAGGGMHILDLADPVNPVRTAYYIDSDYIHDVYVWSDTVVACAEDTYDLVDVTDKSNPQKISSSIALPGIYAHSGWMTEDKRYFIAAEEGNERDIMVWDLEDRNNWELVVDQLKLSIETPVHNIFVKGDYAHISYYKEGYVVLNISNPEAPALAGQFDTYPSNNNFFAGAWGCYPFLPSGNIIVSDMNTGLYILEFDPESIAKPLLSTQEFQYITEENESVGINLTVFDNGEIVETNLFYRQVVDSQKGNWNLLSNPEEVDNNVFQFVIPPQEHLTKVEYYFAVKDDEDITVTLPEGGSGDPAGSNPPDNYFSYTTVFAGIPVIENVSPAFEDTTLGKDSKIEFTVNAIDTTDLQLQFKWHINGGAVSTDTNYTYRLTQFVFENRTDTVDLVISNGFNQVERRWIIYVDITLDREDELNLTYELNQNYPNPFNPSTKIKYSLPEAANVKLNVFNAIGELVTTLVNNYQSPGKYEVNFDASNLSSGFYIAQIVTENFQENIKMLLVK